MLLSDYLKQGTIIHKKAKLLVDLSLSDGESRKIGDIVDVLMKNQDGTYHVEDNDFACSVNCVEIEFIR